MRKKLGLTLVLVVLLGSYLGWVYYGRWDRKQKLMDTLEEKHGPRDRPLAKIYGGGRLTIISFYTTAPVIRPGEKSQLCYGVSGAESVRIEPPVENVWPSISRCVDVAPEKDTVYKLIAEDEDGNKATAEAAVTISKN